MSYPTIETPRLRTRFLTPEDYKLWIPFFEHEECIRFLPFAIGQDKEDSAKKWMERQVQRYADNLYGMQWLIDKETGAYVGQCGLLIQDINGNTETEVGYHLLREHWGKGYATEAAQGFRDLGFQLGHTSIISIIDRKNFASQQVAIRNGMSRDVECVWRDIEVVIFRKSLE